MEPPKRGHWFVEKQNAQERYEECKKCEKFISASTQCRVCLCFMPIKSKLNMTQCPLGKWDDIDIKYEHTVHPPPMAPPVGHD